MLVGGAGCGKTVLVYDKLQSMKEDYVLTTIPFNHYTTSLMLQGVMERPLEKKAGEWNWGKEQGLGSLWKSEGERLMVIDGK